MKLQEGTYIAERFGLSVLEVLLVKQATGDELSRTTVRDGDNLARWRWEVHEAGLYYVVVCNQSTSIRTDYILKFIKSSL